MPRRNQQSMMRQSRRRAARRQNEPPVDPEPSWYAGPMFFSRPVSEPISRTEPEDDVTTILPPLDQTHTEYQAPMEILDHIERARRAEEMRYRSYINATALPTINREAQPRMPRFSDTYVGTTRNFMEDMVEFNRVLRDASHVLGIREPRRGGMSDRVGEFIRYMERAESIERVHEECKEEHNHCVVCLMDIQIGEQITRLTKCVHIFHAECVDPWLDSRHTCPTCRSNEDTWLYDWKTWTPRRGTPVIIDEAAYTPYVSEERLNLMRRMYGEDPAHRVSHEDAAIEDVYTLFIR